MPINPDNPPDDFRSVLASVDRQGRRKWQFTDIAMGTWRKRRIFLAFFLIGLYVAVPFHQHQRSTISAY